MFLPGTVKIPAKGVQKIWYPVASLSFCFYRIYSSIHLHTPEFSCIGFSNYAALSVHLEIPKIQDMERVADRMEAHIYLLY